LTRIEEWHVKVNQVSSSNPSRQQMTSPECPYRMLPTGMLRYRYRVASGTQMHTLILCTLLH
jgi:hypothetical protein